MIRNFCIIAHIDHGKSTLADRMLEKSGVIENSSGQLLDKMDLEQEKGITIKLAPSRMYWKGYELNLIDTPGHVDFQYEVSRSIASVEGAILLIDASQGVQAQTLSTLYNALDYGLEIIPVLNKIDLPAAKPEQVAEEIEKLVGLPKEDIIKVSAKTGENVDEVMDAIIERFQDPFTFKESNVRNYFFDNCSTELKQANFYSRALIFDSIYDKYKGVVAYVKVFEGEIKKSDTVNLVYSGNQVTISELGYFYPNYTPSKSLKAGQIGYIVTGQKSVREAKIGDTILYISDSEKEKQEQFGLNKKQFSTLTKLAIPGFKKIKPFVYSGVYPIDNKDFEKLRDSFEKLTLNDSAIDYDYENSPALGHGFRAGFLGTLHMNIIKERLKREYEVETIFTIPNVIYLVKVKNKTEEKIKSGTNVMEIINSGYLNILLNILGEENELEEDEVVLYEKYKNLLESWLLIRSGADMPQPGNVDEIYEPVAEMEIVGPNEYSGNIMELCGEYRSTLKAMEYIDDFRLLRRYEAPLGEILVDFYDKLKSSTKGFGTMNYEFKGYKLSDLVRLDVYINNELVDSFSNVVHKDKSYDMGKSIVEKLKELIPKHLFPIPVQAGIGGRIIAREDIPALKKDVIAKCYGGDVTRKRKLLAKQKEGKKKMKQMGKVSIPDDIFVKIVSRD